MEVIQNEDLLNNAKLRGEQIKTALSQFPEIQELRGMACMIGLEMPFPVKEFRKTLIKEYGVFTGSSSQANTLRILPSLAVSKTEVEEFIAAFGECLSAFKKQANYAAFFVH